MDTTGIVVLSIVSFGAAWIWWKYYQQWKVERDQPHDVGSFEREYPGVKSGFNGIEMYGGDPELMSRVEKKLKDAAKLADRERRR